MKMFTENGTKASKLRCEGYISCSPGELENLLGILGATFLDCQHHLDSAFFDHPTIGNVRSPREEYNIPASLDGFEYYEV